MLEENQKAAARCSGTLYEPVQGFPLKTVAEFNELDTDDKDSEEKREKLV